MTQHESHSYVISVGSNIDSGREMVGRGLDYLSGFLSAVRKSEIYSTRSVSRGDDSIYCNAVISGDSSLSVDQMLRILKNWEVSVGRRHDSKEVTGDMDLVMVDGVVVRRRDYDREYFQIGFSQIARTEDSIDICED